MPILQANGINTYYELHGGGASPPLVMTHGFAGPTDHWRHEALPLAADRTLLLYDVRGHGRTEVSGDPSEYSMPVFAADLAALLRCLGIERAHVGGVSMGGMIVAQFALNFPDMMESLLLCDTTGGNTGGDDAVGRWERQLSRGIAALSHIAREHGLDETVRRQHEWDREHDPHWNDRPTPPETDYERIKLMTVAGYVGSALAIAQRPDLTLRLREITAPTLIMVGEWDDFLPCALRDHELIQGSRLVVRRECGHGSNWRTETFQQAIADFLDDVEAGRPLAGERRV